MTIKYVSNGIMVATLLAAAAAVPVYASEFDLESHRQSNRPPINPDFAPDRSCMFDAYQLKCIPGSEQSCHEVGFGNNEDATCFFKHPNGCPEGYFSADDDETGQCYKTSEGGCEDSYVERDGERFNYILLEGQGGEGGNGTGDRCANPSYLCDDEQPDLAICKEYRNSN